MQVYRNGLNYPPIGICAGFYIEFVDLKPQKMEGKFHFSLFSCNFSKISLFLLETLASFSILSLIKDIFNLNLYEYTNTKYRFQSIQNMTTNYPTILQINLVTISIIKWVIGNIWTKLSMELNKIFLHLRFLSANLVNIDVRETSNFIQEFQEMHEILSSLNFFISIFSETFLTKKKEILTIFCNKKTLRKRNKRTNNDNWWTFRPKNWARA